jgi:hypothetical protein
VPSRKRPKAAKPDVEDPVARFGALLRESAAREEAERQRLRRERDEAAVLARAEAERAAAQRDAQRELDRAIAELRRARERRSGVAAAESAWRAAKARVIEFETGAPPSWAAPPPAAADDYSDDDGDSDGASAPADGAS